MDSTKSGSVKMSEMQKHFSPLSHPDVVSKKITAEELLHGLFGCLQPPFGVGTKGMSGCITYAVSPLLAVLLIIITSTINTGF